MNSCQLHVIDVSISAFVLSEQINERSYPNNGGDQKNNNWQISISSVETKGLAPRISSHQLRVFFYRGWYIFVTASARACMCPMQTSRDVIRETAGNTGMHSGQVTQNECDHFSTTVVYIRETLLDFGFFKSFRWLLLEDIPIFNYPVLPF